MTNDPEPQESPPDLEILAAGIEAILFTSSEPVSLERLHQSLPAWEPERIQTALDLLDEQFQAPSRGLSLHHVAGGWQLRTKAVFSELLQRFHRKVRRVRLSMPALETLSIIAYVQPVSTPEIEAIRGVSVQQTIRGLIDKELVKIVGRKEAPGRPMMYGTTEKFLELFGLPNLGTLPSIPELDKWKKEYRSGSPELALVQDGAVKT